ncbi:hypothetical protein ECEC1865_4830, partial [Escherichia coli EC1865]
MTGAA